MISSMNIYLHMHGFGSNLRSGFPLLVWTDDNIHLRARKREREEERRMRRGREEKENNKRKGREEGGSLLATTE